MAPTSFLDVPQTSHFSLQNLPYGVFSSKSGAKRRIGVALGSNVIDLAALSDAGLFTGPLLKQSKCFNEVMSLIQHSDPSMEYQAYHTMLKYACL